MADKITADNLKSQKNDFVIIDVREADELEGGKIEGSVHMPLGLSIRNAKKKQIEDLRDKKICTYGFNAVTLEGGYPSWNQS
jgi:rhodanese-related sulfurtransferase